MTILFFLALMVQDRTTSVFVDRIAIKVNDKIITERELATLYKQLRQEALQNASGAELDQMLNDAWQRAVDEAEETLLLYEKAVEAGVAFSRDETISLLGNIREQAGMTEEEFEQEIQKQTNLTLQELIDKRMRDDSARAAVQSQVLNRINFEDNEIAKYYTENQEDYLIPATYRIAEIVFRKDGGTPAEISAKIANCRAQLEAGSSFADTASSLSDSFSRENGGDLGKVEYGDLLQVIEQAVNDLEVGEISQTLETPSSFFIIKVLEKTPARPKPLDEVRDLIVKSLREPRMEQALEDFLRELRTEFVVETYVKVLPAYLEH